MIARSCTARPSEHPVIDERCRVRARVDCPGCDRFTHCAHVAQSRAWPPGRVRMEGREGASPDRPCQRSSAPAPQTRPARQVVVAFGVQVHRGILCYRQRVTELTHDRCTDLHERAPCKITRARTVEWTKARRRRIAILDCDPNYGMRRLSGLDVCLLTGRARRPSARSCPTSASSRARRRSWCSVVRSATARTSTEQGPGELRLAAGCPRERSWCWRTSPPSGPRAVAVVAA
jgi:hypothetical protein